MPWEIVLAAGGLITLSAALYSSVGHGGGSGYLAVMALFSMAPSVMRPAALVLNVAVSSITLVAFARRGAFSWRVLWPFAISAVPFAFLGGRLVLPGLVYKPVLALVLLLSAAQLLRPTTRPVDDPALRPPIGPALAVGGGIGLLAGITGIGGGVFLSPVLLLNRWAATRTTAGVSAAFILLNSLSGLAGQLSTLSAIPATALAVWAPSAIVGGLVGSRFGSRRANPATIYRLLAVVLVVAAAKLLLTLGD